MGKRAELILEIKADDAQVQAVINRIKAEAGKIALGSVRGTRGGPSPSPGPRPPSPPRPLRPDTSSLRFMNDEISALNRLGMREAALSKTRQMYAIKYAGDLQKQTTMLGLVDKQLGKLKSQQGLMGSFETGWKKAGGLGSALGTVVKYGLAYRGIDMAIRASMAPLNQSIKFVKDATIAWVDYEEQMAKAARTMRQPGMKTDAIKGVMGRDALEFTTKYRVSLEQAAQAQYELGSAGFTAAQALATYQVPLKVSIALQSDVTQTTRLMTQMLKIHGKQMGENMTDTEKMTKLGGILARTWEIEQVELSDIAAAYKYVAANVSTLNLKAEELIPTIGFLSTYGLRGSIGGTGLNQFFTQTAKNFKITKNQVLEIQKMVRGGGHKFDLGIKADQLTSPLQILIQMSKAVQGMKGNLAGQMKVAGIYADIFNIRGARPAQLLSDLDKLGELLEHIGAVSGDAKGGAESLNKALEQMQHTPKGQLDLMRNTIYKMGVDFITSAGAGTDFVDSLENIRKAIGRLMPYMSVLGEYAGKALEGALNVIEKYGHPDEQNFTALQKFIFKYHPLGKLMEIGALGAQGANEFAAKSIEAGASSAAGEAYFRATGTEAEKRKVGKAAGKQFATKKLTEFAKSQGYALTEDQLGFHLQKDIPYKPLFAEGAPVESLLKPLNNLMSAVSAKEAAKFFNSPEAVAALTAYYNSNAILNMNLESSADTKKGEDWRRRIKELQEANAAYTELPGGKGAGHGGVEPKYWKTGEVGPLGYTISSGFSKTGHGGAHNAPGVFDIGGQYLRNVMKVDPKIVMKQLEAAGYFPVYENKASGDHTTGEDIHVMTPGMTPKNWEKWGNEVRKKHGYKPLSLTKGKESGAMDYQKFVDELVQQQMSDITNMMTLGLMGPGSAMGAYGGLSKIGGLTTSAQAQLLQAKNQLGGQMAETGLSFREMQRSKSAQTYTDQLKKLDTALQNVDAREKLYGETVSTTQEKMSLLEQKEAALADATKDRTKYLEDWTGRYKQINDILWSLMNKGKLTSGQQKDAMGIFGFVPNVNNIDTVMGKLGEARGNINGANDALMSFDETMTNARNSTVELGRALLDLPLKNLISDLERTIGLTQSMFSAKGMNYDLSDQRLSDIAAQRHLKWKEFENIINEGGEPGADLDVIKRRLDDKLSEITKLGYDEEGIARQRRMWAEDMGLKMRTSQRSWFRGTPKQMAAMQQVQGLDELHIEIARLREEFAKVPEFQPWIDKYEQVMTTEKLVRPWQDARDKIEGDWIGMFQNMFSEFSKGNFKGGIQGFVQSIVGPIQGQMVQGWVKKNLGGLFDQLATQETGIATPKQGEITATIEATNALNQFTMALQGSIQSITGGGAYPSVPGATPNIFIPGVTPGAPSALSMAAGGADLGSGGKYGLLGMLGAKTMKDAVHVGVVDASNDPQVGTKTKAQKAKAYNSSLGGILQNYSAGSMVGGMVGGLFGYDEESAGMAGGLGYAAGMALGFGPWGAAALGLASIFGFGKKKKTSTDPKRDIYGMPAFEWESYLYNLYQRTTGASGPAGIHGGGIAVSDNRNITIHVNGGDTHQVRKVINDVLSSNFGTRGQIALTTGRAM